jgi:glutamine transport system ATP-binding protein
LLFLDGGHLVHDGKPAELLSEPPSGRFREFLQHVY